EFCSVQSASIELFRAGTGCRMAAIVFGRGVDQIPACAGRTRIGVRGGSVLDDFARLREFVGDGSSGLDLVGAGDAGWVGHCTLLGSASSARTVSGVV